MEGSRIIVHIFAIYGEAIHGKRNPGKNRFGDRIISSVLVMLNLRQVFLSNTNKWSYQIIICTYESGGEIFVKVNVLSHEPEPS